MSEANYMLAEILKKNQLLFAPVVEFDSNSDKLVLLDFTRKNKEINNEMLSSTESFTSYINKKLVDKKALYGIGGYNEHRTIYSISEVFDADNALEEPRRLHVGIDIWGKPFTKIMAPLEGTVHSFAFNNRFGDYGATIILEHILDNITFYTLYGHLSLNSIKNLQTGNKIGKGDVFAEFGIPSENGNWPPHLHIQLIASIGDWQGDYPGVCKYSERKKWLFNSPDPDIVLQLLQFANPGS